MKICLYICCNNYNKVMQSTKLHDMEIPFNNFIKNCEVTRNNKHEFDIVGFEEEIFFRVDISNGWKIVRNEGVELPSSDAATQILFNKIDVLIEEEAPLEMEYESPYSEYDNQI